MLRFLILTFFVLLTTHVSATCDFVTSQFSEKLQNPGNVERIDIEIKKSKKWAANGLKMILDDREFIRPKWKKKFSADIQVTYPFGTCTYSAKVRQNGDWRDHQEFKNGQLRQSLDVGLINGNIANVVDFKLFLPRTRNSNNETLATLILRKMGILAPKTFTVDVSVNGVVGSYLFQEKASKELLEAMGRREGPLFEGDEALLWSFKGFSPMDLLPVSGSKLTNYKWARRGENSTKMAFDAYMELQKQFLLYAAPTIEKNRFFLDPNSLLAPSSTYPEYHAAVIAFSGWHGLWGLNRKFYWNALSGEFEPIYYDGMVSFEKLSVPESFSKRPFEAKLWHDHFRGFDFADLAARIEAAINDDFIDEFAMLAKMNFEDARNFALPKISLMVSNLAVLKDFSSSPNEYDTSQIGYEEALRRFIDANETFGLTQRFVSPKVDNGSHGYFFDCLQAGDCDISQLGEDQVVDLMSKQQLGDQRILIVPLVSSFEVNTAYLLTRVGSIEVSHSESAKVEYDAKKRHLSLYQTRADDWFLIKNNEIPNMTISMIGRKAEIGENGGQQRFNQFGLTGCLTFYQVVFEETKIEASNGVCEDSVNIVSSRGTIETIHVDTSFSDAIDSDFSHLEIEKVRVNKAGNDCIDVSGGVYSVFEAQLTECSDKGISVGENSSVKVGKISVDTAKIGASSKDFSDLTINQFKAENVETCLEANHKKQEFGGGRIDINIENCDRAKVLHDLNSVIILGGDRFELSD